MRPMGPMRIASSLPEALHPSRWAHWPGMRFVRHALAWCSQHTGLPVVVVAAIGLVLAWRVAKKTAHVFLEVTVALVILLTLTKLGWIRW